MKKLHAYNPGGFKKRFIAYKKRMNSKPNVLVEWLIKKLVAKNCNVHFNVEKHNRSNYSVEKLYESLDKYDDEVSGYEYDGKLLDKVMKLTADSFRSHLFGKETPSKLQDVSADIDMSKSAGLPTMESKGIAYPAALLRAQQIINGEKYPHPCIAFHKTGFNDKTRLVWGYPLEMTILEAKFAPRDRKSVV